jgi:hypothetical protein
VSRIYFDGTAVKITSYPKRKDHQFDLRLDSENQGNCRASKRKIQESIEHFEEFSETKNRFSVVREPESRWLLKGYSTLVTVVLFPFWKMSLGLRASERFLGPRNEPQQLRSIYSSSLVYGTIPLAGLMTRSANHQEQRCRTAGKDQGGSHSTSLFFCWARQGSPSALLSKWIEQPVTCPHPRRSLRLGWWPCPFVALSSVLISHSSVPPPFTSLNSCLLLSVRDLNPIYPQMMRQLRLLPPR